MDNLILKLIVFYQRIVSPRKGYRCAYSVLHHTQGCSGAVKDIIHNKGVVDGWREIRQRFADCRVAAETLQQQKLAANPAGKKDVNREESAMLAMVVMLSLAATVSAVPTWCRISCRIWIVLATVYQ